MHVLYFSPRICWPLLSGGHLRTFYLARQLLRKATLTYVGLDSAGQVPLGTVSRVYLEQLGNAEVLRRIRRDSGYTLASVVRGFIGPTPLNVLNYTSAPAVAELERILHSRTFDAVQIEGVHLIAYAKRIRQLAPHTPLICDWPNIESEILRRYAENDSSWLRRLYALRTAALVRPLENQLLHLCHAHTVCSERERDILLRRVPQAHIEVVGNGVDVEYFTANSTENGVRRDLVFMGRMDYHVQYRCGGVLR